MTYRLSDDARKCIATVHGAIWDGGCPQHMHTLPSYCLSCWSSTSCCHAFNRSLWLTQG